MEIKEILAMQKQVKAKLMSAVALLLVSAILLSTSTYAWFVLSTAPEVSEMKTTAGANGALAIALQSTTTTGSRAEITNGVGDTGSNTTWGGLVDLEKNYGLEKISLSPARLNLNGTSVVRGSPLSIPQFGIDGRVSALTPMGTVYYSADGADGTAGTFVEGFNYGVNIVGKQDDLSGAGASITRTMDRQWLIDTSTAKISTMRAEMLEKLQKVILDNSTGIANLLELYLSIASGAPAVTEDDYNTVKSLTDVFQGVIGDAAVALRYALLACCAADVTTYQPGKDGEEALSAVYAKYSKLELENTEDATAETVKSIAEANLANQQGNTALRTAYQAIVDAVTSVSGAQKKIGMAQGNLTNYLTATNATTKNTELGYACTALITVDNMYIGPRGDAGERIKITSNLDQAMSIFCGDTMATYTYITLDLYAVRGSGLFYTMALVLGDYKALVDHFYEDSQIVDGELVDVQCEKVIDLYATAANSCEGFNTFVNTGCLQSAYDAAAPLRVSGTVTYTMDTSTHLNAYGYAVDLAFRSSAGGKLLLQQGPADRMTSGTSDSAASRLPEQQNIQGGGSTMTFTVADDMTEAQARALVQKVYVVFMNTDTGAILGLAAADEASIAVKTNTNATTQKDTREVSATLALYSRDINDGVLTKEALLQEQQITTLAPEVPTYITALVYLDGDAVTGGEMSADTTQSLFGSLNLQFCGDQELTVMPYDGLLKGE